MDSPPYHYYHHYDPTLVNTHTLLTPQAYQQQTSINTHISPEPTYSNFIVKNSPHYLIHHIDSITQQLLHSQRACIHAISKLASDISTLNNNLTPPHFTYQQPHTITSTTMFNHNFNQHSHDPFPPPKSTPFNHHNFTYNNTTTSLTPNWGWDKPFPHQQPFTTCIDQHLQHRPDPLSLPTAFAPLNSDPSQKGNDEIVQSHALVVDGDNFFPSIDSNSQVAADEKKFVNNVDVDIVTEPTHFDVVGKSIFTVPNTDERLRDDVAAVKGQEENNRHVLSSISQSPCDFDHVESLIIQSIVDAPIGSVPAKHR
jgi:hypothetical protein